MMTMNCNLLKALQQAHVEQAHHVEQALQSSSMLRVQQTAMR